MNKESQERTSVAHTTHRFSSAAFLVTLAIVTVLAILVAAPVGVPVILAIITAGLASPLHLWIRRRTGGRRRLAAVLTLVVLVAGVLIPLSALGYFAGARLTRLLQEATSNADSLRQTMIEAIGSLDGGPFGFLLGPGGLSSNQNVFESVVQALGNIAERLTGIAATLPRLLLMLFIYLYSLFFFLLDGRRLLMAFSSAIPLRRAEKREFGRTFLTVSRATLKGTIVIGALQGLIGGAVYWLMGLPAPLLFAVLFAVLAAIPNFGAVLIWFPTAIILLIVGETVQAVILVVVGGGLIGAVDYLVRPVIIRGESQLHQVLAVVGIVGGIALFGLEGLLLGPIIMSLFVATWRTFRGRYRHELKTMSQG